ncbi:MAG TPA: single-stranded DNA-binding protein [Candidatus Cloacimonadota bacterium]|nr:single-stranded DNA-binding protein [Candidatus Cloacimonadota bacterium]HPS38677.1 single-stranded DNA-binding protein [Candidatus Cloacimonadota bacterium]
MADLKLPRINKVMISGRITNDLELKYTPKGTAVIRFTVACDRRYKDESDTWQTATTFLEVVAWTYLAEQVNSQCHKGSAVIVEGRLESRSYVDSNNVNRKIWEIIADNIHMLEWKPKGEASEAGSSDEAPFPSEEAPHPQTKDDVPF